ncbi:MAG: hypothetical protein IPK82_18620 [Polyangiaceae bacterium]|nr:hypothetical protein [Polyangiaceae bacterium]
MALSPRAGLFGGVALLSAAVVLLQIVLTRLFSALFGHHFAFVAISLSLFGIGVGGALLYTMPMLARPPGLLSRLAIHASLASAATLAALLFLMRQKAPASFSAAELGKFALLYCVCSLPFLFSGIAVTSAIRYAARDMSKLYLVDLLAAAVGGAAALVALRLGAPRAFLVVAIVYAFAGLWFSLPLLRGDRAGKSPLSQRAPHIEPPTSLVATMLLGSSVLLAGDFGAPWLKLGDVREVRVDKTEFQRWSILSFVTVDKPVAGMAWLRTDGTAATAILDQKTNAPLHPDEMGYVLQRGEGPALIIGAGGGRDVRAALKAGQKAIDAVEIDPVIVNDVMRGAMSTFSGGLYNKPEVNVSIADGRSFIASSNKQYRAIVLSLVHTSAASSVGALSLSENSLYTTQSIRDLIAHLTAEGTLTINRWDAEFPRLLALATAGLRASGAQDPKAHLFACSHDRTTALLIKRTPYDREEIQKLRRHCQTHHFREVVAPDIKRRELDEQLMFSARGFIDPESGTDYRAPTDDRPFFFHTLSAGSALALLSKPGDMLRDHQGLAMLTAVFGVSVVLMALFAFVPLALARMRRRSGVHTEPNAYTDQSVHSSSGVHTDPEASPRARPLLFFLAIGAGFVLVEMSLIQKLTLFLGHPVYAITVALAALLVSAGIGSLSTSRIALIAAPLAGEYRAQALVGLTTLYAVALGPVLERAMVLPFGVRVFFTIALLLPLGALMGSLAPLGVKLLAPRAASILPWCWSLNGLASVGATAVGAFIALSFGFSATLIAAGAAYVIAAITVPRYTGESAPSSR